MPFPITCTACQKTFSIADDVYERKVKGRVVTIKCKQCQAGIRVDGTKDTPVFSSADAPGPAPATLSATTVATEAALLPEAPLPEAPLPEAPLPQASLPQASLPQALVAPAAPPNAQVPAPAAAAAASASAPTAASAAPVVPAAAPKAAASVTKAATATTTKAMPAAAGKAFSAGSAKATLPITPKAMPSAATPKAATPLAGAAQPTSPGQVPKAAPAAATASPTAAKATTTAARAPLAAARPTLGSAPRLPFTAGAQQPATPLTAKAAPVATTPVAQLPPVAPIVTPAPAPVVATETAAPSAVLWAVDYPDGQDRELTLVEIENELASGAINATSLVWREGMAEWLELGQVPELQKLVPRPALAGRPEPKSAPLAAAPPPPPRVKLPSVPGVELPPARSKLPSASSLDLPKGPSEAIDPGPPAIPRSPTMAGIGRPPTPPQPLDVAALAATPAPAPSFPAAPVMVPAPALAAPFQTQSFARQQPPGAVGASAPTANIPDWPERKSRAPIIIAGIVVVLGIGAAVVFLNRSDEQLPPPVPISALPATTPTPTAAPAAPSEGASENPAPTADAPSRSPGSSAALQPPGSTPTTPSNAGFAEQFANGARRADEKTGAPVGQHFDVAAANKALAAASFETAKCRVAGGPTGKATIVVTFEPSGKVASATVSDAPFAGTASGECISAALKRATVPPFSGLPGTVTKIISIQ